MSLIINSWQEAKEVSRIKRINWKLILGKSFTSYVIDSRKKGIDNEEIVFNILKECKKNSIYLLGWSWPEVFKNVKIGVSARSTEIKIYNKEVLSYSKEPSFPMFPVEYVENNYNNNVL